jgi:hypothetical protein
MRKFWNDGIVIVLALAAVVLISSTVHAQKAAIIYPL